jgi:hypothetical protein
MADRARPGGHAGLARLRGQRSGRALDGVCGRTAPREEFVPHGLRGQVAFGVMAMYAGDPEDGARVIQPLRDLSPITDLVQPMPYTAFQAFLDPVAPKGYRNYWRGEYLKSLSEEAIETFLYHAPELAAAAKPFSQVILFESARALPQSPIMLPPFPTATRSTCSIRFQCGSSPPMTSG